MRVAKSLIVVCLLSISLLSTQGEQSNSLIDRRELSTNQTEASNEHHEDHKKPPPKNTDGNGSAATGTGGSGSNSGTSSSSGGSGSGGSGSGGSVSGGSGGSASGGSSSTGGSGGGSSGSSSTGGATVTGSGGSSSHSSSSSSAGGSSGSGSKDSHLNSDQSEVSHARNGILGIVAAAVIVGVGIAAITMKGRKVEVKPDHPLKGALNRRISLFSHLAKHNPSNRPPRRAEEDVYVPAPEHAGAIV